MGYPTYPRIDKYPKKQRIAVVAKKNWDIPVCVPISQNITIFDVADFKRDMIMIFFFIIYIIIGLLVRFKIFNINIHPTTQWIQKVENITVIRLRIY